MVASFLLYTDFSPDPRQFPYSEPRFKLAGFAAVVLHADLSMKLAVASLPPFLPALRPSTSPLDAPAAVRTDSEPPESGPRGIPLTPLRQEDHLLLAKSIFKFVDRDPKKVLGMTIEMMGLTADGEENPDPPPPLSENAMAAAIARVYYLEFRRAGLAKADLLAVLTEVMRLVTEALKDPSPNP